MLSVGERIGNFLEIENISAGYDGNMVLREVSFSIPEGQFLAIAGPNGAGKSTLLRVLAGLKEPLSGRMLLRGQEIKLYPRRHLARMVSVILQEFSSFNEFTVYDMVSLGRSPFLLQWKPLSEYDHQIILSAMEMTSVRHLQHRSFLELSGGERQRVLIAKALAQQPSILLLDEPATHLDLLHQVNIFNILEKLNKENQVTIICVTHDLSLSAQYINRLILLDRGRLIADGSPRDLLNKQLLEDLFCTSISVGCLNETDTPYVCPLRI